MVIAVSQVIILMVMDRAILKGWTNCSKLGYYITGIYRGSGDWLKNIDKFRCCNMATGNEITSKILYDV